MNADMLTQSTFPIWSVEGRLFYKHEAARQYALVQAIMHGRPVKIMQKDDDLFEWFLLEKVGGLS